MDCTRFRYLLSLFAGWTVFVLYLCLCWDSFRSLRYRQNQFSRSWKQTIFTQNHSVILRNHLFLSTTFIYYVFFFYYLQDLLFFFIFKFFLVDFVVFVIVRSPLSTKISFREVKNRRLASEITLRFLEIIYFFLRSSFFSSVYVFDYLRYLLRYYNSYSGWYILKNEDRQKK